MALQCVTPFAFARAPELQAWADEQQAVLDRELDAIGVDTSQDPHVDRDASRARIRELVAEDRAILDALGTA